MSTTIVESWAVDIATLGPIYPFVGSEGLLVVLALAAWIVWQIWQMGSEKKQEEQTLQRIRADRQQKASGEGSASDSM